MSTDDATVIFPWDFSRTVIDSKNLGRATTILVEIPIGILWSLTPKRISGVEDVKGKEGPSTRMEKGEGVGDRPERRLRVSGGGWVKEKLSEGQILGKCWTLA